MSDTIESLSTNFQEIKDNPPALTKSVKAQYRVQLDNYLDILRKAPKYDLDKLKVLLTKVNKKKEEFTKAYDNYPSLESVIGDDLQSHNCNLEEIKMIIENAKKEKKSLNCEIELSKPINQAEELADRVAAFIRRKLAAQVELDDAVLAKARALGVNVDRLVAEAAEMPQQLPQTAKSPNSFNRDKALACLCLTHEEIKRFYGMQRIYLLKLMKVIQDLITDINYRNMEMKMALEGIAEVAQASQQRRDGGSTKKHKHKKIKKVKKHKTKKHKTKKHKTKKHKTKRRNK